MEAWLQVLFPHLIEITALVMMICMGACLLIVRIFRQWKRRKKYYPPAFIVQLLMLFTGFIALPVWLAIKNDLSLLLILCLALLILSLLFAFHGVGVTVYRHYYHWVGREHVREQEYDHTIV